MSRWSDVERLPTHEGDGSVVRLVRNRRVVELLVDVDPDRIVLDFAGVDGDRGDGGDTERFTCSEVEAGVVRWADQGVVVL